jgi:hypothetical protein
MTISEHACDGCGYSYQGSGGLGLMMRGTARQTVSCAACRALHDVDVGVNLLEAMNARRKQRRRGPGRRTPAAAPTLQVEVAKLRDFACPVDASHPVRPWTDEDAGMIVPDAVVSFCPRCEGHVCLVKSLMEVD